MSTHPIDRRIAASLIDRVLLPFGVSAAAAAVLPYLGVAIDSPLRTWVPIAASFVLPCALVASPVGWLGLRIMGLRLRYEDGRSVPAGLRALIEAVWLLLSSWPLLGLPLLVNAAVVLGTRRSLADHVLGTVVAPIVPAAAPLLRTEEPNMPVLATDPSSDTGTTLVPVETATPPAPTYTMPTEVGGRPVASVAARLMSTAVDVVIFSAVFVIPNIVTRVRMGHLAAAGPASAHGLFDMWQILFGSLAMVLGLLAAYVLVQLTLLVGWSTSLGKLVVGLRVVDPSGGPAAISGRIVRAVVPPVFLLIPFGGLIVPIMIVLAYARGQRPFQDRMSNTLVVSVRA